MNSTLRTLLSSLVLSTTMLTSFAALAPDGTADASLTSGASVSPCQPDNIQVCSITLTSTKTGTNSYTITGKVNVTLESYPYSAIQGATVNITWSRSGTTPVKQSALTSSSGVATFTTTGPKSTYTLNVNSVSKSGYNFDSANSTLTKSLSN